LDVALLLKMRHSPVRNYVVPGLTSWLIGAPSEHGCVRLFESEREHMEVVIPHSHRFDFQCWVLRGTVRNRVWNRSYGGGDLFMVSTHTKGRMGAYSVQEVGRDRYDYVDTVYAQDEWYSMTHDEIHSIWFWRGARVLFFEGPQVVDYTKILEPIANNVRVQTFKVEPWMFERD
jgi:hypothetical protein